jgi:hypothetical protein
MTQAHPEGLSMLEKRTIEAEILKIAGGYFIAEARR